MTVTSAKGFTLILLGGIALGIGLYFGREWAEEIADMVLGR